MKFTDLNPKREIGAHSMLLELGEFRVLIDGGVSPKDVGLASLPDYNRIKPNSLDLILLSHCHLDHIGSLPCIHRNQSSARVLMTPASSEILPIMLQNSYTVMLKQRSEKEIEDYPLFSRKEAEAVAEDIFHMHYGRTREFVKNNDRLKVTFYPAGHVMGAASILLEHRNKKYFCTGDILFRKQHTLTAAQLPAMQVDTVIMETTRGQAEVEDGFTHEKEVERLLESINKTLRGGGSCLLPVFALGRMQEIVSLIYHARQKKIIPSSDIYCSGLGLAVVDVFEKIHRDRKKYGLDYRPANAMEVPSVRQDLRHPLAPKGESVFRKRMMAALNVKPLVRGRLKAGRDFKKPSLFITSSGMLVENTPAYQIAACLLGHERNLVAFTGFCDEDTPGGKLLTKQKGDVFSFHALEYETAIKATVERFDLSGHADREDLVHVAKEMNPSSIILSHGDVEAREWFQGVFAERLPQVKIYNPEPQRTYEI